MASKQDPMALSALSPRTPSPMFDRSVLSSTPTPTRFRQTKGPEGTLFCKPPQYVYYALREEDDAAIGFSALSPEEALEPADALSAKSIWPSQFICTTASAEAALEFAESGSGPMFAGAHGRPRSASKRVVAKIDLSGFKGEVIDVSSTVGCEQHGLKKDSMAWEFALDQQIILLVGYVHPRFVTASFDLEECSNLPRDWVGEAAGQRIQCTVGRNTRDTQGLITDAHNHAVVCWEAKQRLDEEMKQLEARQQRIAPHLEIVMDRELMRCDRAVQNALKNGTIGPAEGTRTLVMRNWRCIEEFPYWAATSCHQESEVWLRGTQFQTRLALNGPAAMEQVHRVAAEANQAGNPCRHCTWTKPAEFHLLRNVALDGTNVRWPPYFRLFCFDPATEELDELLNTTRGAFIRDSEHPHVFPSDEVGFSFALERLPTALAGLEATLPREDVGDLSEVALPQRPLYLVLVVPRGAPFMQGQAHEVAPLYVEPCELCSPCTL